MRGSKIYLERIREDYNDLLREWRNNPAIMDWCRQTNLISEEEQKRWFAWQDKDPNTQMYVIRTIRDKILVGVCGLTSIDHLHRRAEFSLYIGPSYRGCGHGRDALITLFKHGFDDLNLNLIWGETFDGNPAMNMFLSVGMQIDGKRRQYYFKKGFYIDAHLVSIKKEELNA